MTCANCGGEGRCGCDWEPAMVLGQHGISVRFTVEEARQALADAAYELRLPHPGRAEAWNGPDCVYVVQASEWGPDGYLQPAKQERLAVCQLVGRLCAQSPALTVVMERFEVFPAIAIVDGWVP